MADLKIPFFDIGTTYRELKPEIDEAVQRVLVNGWYILGKEVDLFEKEFAEYCGVKYCVGVGSGLDALVLIMRAYKELGYLQNGDEIIVPANTYIASILAILESGLTPIIVEPKLNTFNIDPANVEKMITSKTKGIIAVHLYGQLAEMGTLQEVALNNGLLLIEDAAQAHGARNAKGEKAGNLGNAAGFSFYPGKNLGAFGDAGAVTTNDSRLAEMVRIIRNYGSDKKYYNEVRGVNSRLDELHAAVLSVKLKYLDKHNTQRMRVARKYIDLISNSEIILPNWSFENDHVFHLFVIRSNNRNILAEYLQKKSIQTMIHYPVPPHKQRALIEYKNLHLPISERIHSEVLSIPINPFLKENDIYYVIDCISKFQIK